MTQYRSSEPRVEHVVELIGVLQLQRVKSPAVRAPAPDDASRTEPHAVPVTALLLEAAKSNLVQFLRHLSNELFDLRLVIDVFLQLVNGVVELHAHKIRHGDIRAENVLVFKDGTLVKVKLCDFNLSTRFESLGQDTYGDGE